MHVLKLMQNEDTLGGNVDASSFVPMLHTYKESSERHPLLHKFSIWVLCTNHALTEEHYKPPWSWFPNLFCTGEPIALPWSVAQAVIKIAEEVLWNLPISILLDIPLCVPMHAGVPHATPSIGAHFVCVNYHKDILPTLHANITLDASNIMLANTLP